MKPDFLLPYGARAGRANCGGVSPYWTNVYVGIFAADVLRTTTELVRHVKAAGIGAVINFPSVSFVGDNAGAIFDRLSVGIDREIGFLGECANQGLRIGGVIGSVKAAKALLQIGVDFLIIHGGPPVLGSVQPDSEVATKAIREIKRPNHVPVFPLSELIRPGRSVRR